MALIRLLLRLTLLLAFTSLCFGTDEFIISYWWGPPARENPERRYAEIAECNFTHAGFPAPPTTVEQNKSILDACQRHGLKLIVNDARILQFTPEQPQFQANLDAILADYANHPAIAAFHVADEPGVDAFRVLGAVNQYLLQKSPEHLPWINLLPNHAPESALGGTYEDHVEKFLTTVKPRLLCFDHYGLMKDGTERPIYFENLEIIRRQGLKYSTPFGFIFQLTPHGPFRDTTEEDLRWQVNTALAYGAKALFYFTYWTPEPDGANTFYNGIIGRDGLPTVHYEMAKRNNAEVKCWAPTLMKLTSTGVYHTGAVPVGCRALEPNSGIGLKGEISFVLGTFVHEDGSQWLMVVNRDLHRGANATLHLGGQTAGVEELSSKDGALSLIHSETGEVELQLPPAGARLWKLNKR